MARALPASSLASAEAAAGVSARRPRRPPAWTLLALPVAALIAAPVLAVAVGAADAH